MNSNPQQLHEWALWHVPTILKLKTQRQYNPWGSWPVSLAGPGLEFKILHQKWRWGKSVWRKTPDALPLNTHPQAHVHGQRSWFFWNIDHNICPSKNISVYSYTDSEWFPLGMIYFQSKSYSNMFPITKEWSGHGNGSLGKVSTRENWLVKFVLWPPHVSWCTHHRP